jgi:hypothetical protein
MSKSFRLRAEEIKALVSGKGSCFASDLITVHGHKVGFMYREEPAEEQDSGWRFVAGVETDDYMDEPQNFGVYDVNTIANYSPDIVPLLDAPVGATFERDEHGALVEIKDLDEHLE